MQPPFRRLHSGSPLRSDLAGASLCATRASSPLQKGKNAFSRPMTANTHTTNLEPVERHDVAIRCLLSELRQVSIYRGPTLRTSHNGQAPSRL